MNNLPVTGCLSVADVATMAFDKSEKFLVNRAKLLRWKQKQRMRWEKVVWREPIRNVLTRNAMRSGLKNRKNRARQQMVSGFFDD